MENSEWSKYKAIIKKVDVKENLISEKKKSLPERITKKAFEKVDFNSEEIISNPLKSSLFDNYDLVKIIDYTETVSLYLIKDIVKDELFILKKILKDTIDELYEKVINDEKEKKKDCLKIENDGDSSDIINFFIDDEYFYLLFKYKENKNIEEIKTYPSIGKILNNRYMVLKGISCKSSALVYLVWDLSLKKYWALKEIKSEDYSGEEEIKRNFKAQAKNLTSLKHPNLPEIFDFFVEEKKLYLVMEYLTGKNIQELIIEVKDNYFAESQVMPWAITLCDVLNYLHNLPEPFIFNDLKPDNIIITDKGELKLIDFGIGRIFGKEKDRARYVQLSEGYTSQEQWFGKADLRNDIYSLGVTLYHIFSGIHPREIAPHFPPLEQFNPSVSPALNKIIMKSLHPEAKKRYQSVEKIKKELIKLYNTKKIQNYIKKAKEWENKGNFMKASLEYTKALELEENYNILIAIAKSYEKIGLNEAALEHYNKILKYKIPEKLRRTILAKLHIINKKMEGENFSDRKSHIYDTIPIDINDEYIKIEEDIKAKLICYRQGKGGKSVPIYKDLTSIGRARTNDLSLGYDHQVSSRHAQIICEYNNFFIEDLGSTNNTYVNGFEINSRTELNSNDKIQIGSTVLIFAKKATGVRDEEKAAISPGSPSDPAKLIYYKYGRRKISVPLNKDLIKIGRARNNDIALEYDLEVSAVHAQIIREGNNYFIEDLKSTNSTYINDVKINEKTKLMNNDIVKIGYVNFTFLSPHSKYSKPLLKFLF